MFTLYGLRPTAQVNLNTHIHALKAVISSFKMSYIYIQVVTQAIMLRLMQTHDV